MQGSPPVSSQARSLHYKTSTAPPVTTRHLPCGAWARSTYLPFPVSSFSLFVSLRVLLSPLLLVSPYFTYYKKKTHFLHSQTSDIETAS